MSELQPIAESSAFYNPRLGCPSTHGGAGYAPGSYWKGAAIICGLCGYEIQNPPPTGAKNGQATWPDWIGQKDKLQ